MSSSPFIRPSAQNLFPSVYKQDGEALLNKGREAYLANPSEVRLDGNGVCCEVSEKLLLGWLRRLNIDPSLRRGSPIHGDRRIDIGISRGVAIKVE